MGWTSYVATHYKRNGRVDCKTEMDEQFTQREHDEEYNNKIQHYPKMEVVKSSMVGSIYYAAVRTINSQTGYDHTWAAVCLTSTKIVHGMNFGYKIMDESCGPFCFDCPKGILDLLSSTDNEIALEWRRKCRERLQQKKEGNTVGTLPIGSIIEYKDWNGNTVQLRKMAPAYQFKRPWWYLEDNNTYIPSRRIPDNFKIIRKGDEKSEE